jgi:hypothetical protein
MKKSFVLTIAIVFASLTLNAQDYNWAVGARLSDFMGGISVKKSLSEKSKIEGIFAVPYWRGINLTGLYEQNLVNISKRFPVYAGAGAHAGSWKYKSNNDDNKRYFFVGADVILGAEYTFPSVPLSLSIDYKPSYNIAEHSGFNFADGGIAIRYTF